MHEAATLLDYLFDNTQAIGHVVEVQIRATKLVQGDFALRLEILAAFLVYDADLQLFARVVVRCVDLQEPIDRRLESVVGQVDEHLFESKLVSLEKLRELPRQSHWLVLT